MELPTPDENVRLPKKIIVTIVIFVGPNISAVRGLDTVSFRLPSSQGSRVRSTLLVFVIDSRSHVKEYNMSSSGRKVEASKDLNLLHTLEVLAKFNLQVFIDVFC